MKNTEETGVNAVSTQVKKEGEIAAEEEAAAAEEEGEEGEEEEDDEEEEEENTEHRIRCISFWRSIQNTVYQQ